MKTALKIFPAVVAIFALVICSTKEENKTEDEDFTESNHGDNWNEDPEKNYAEFERQDESREQDEKFFMSGTSKANNIHTLLLKGLISKYNGDLERLKNEIKVNFSSVDPSVYPPGDTFLKINLNLALINYSKQYGRFSNLHPEEFLLYDNWSKFSNGIRGIGVRKYISAAVDFCKNVAQKGTIEIISVGSGNGEIEKEIIKSYRDQFAIDLRITLIDIDPQLQADYKTVDELIEKRPTVIGNCVLIINWPVQRAANKDDYDIKAIHKLQPHEVLTVYEAACGMSGSLSFEKFLYDTSLDVPPSGFGCVNWMSKYVEINYKLHDYGLSNYLIQEVARQDVFVNPIEGTYIVRMVKLKRNDVGWL